LKIYKRKIPKNYWRELGKNFPETIMKCILGRENF
jgi:hypothetical protein